MNKNIKICFMGSPKFGRIVLEKLDELYNVVLVVTQPDSTSNGGRKVNIPEVKKYAIEHNIECFQSENIKLDHSRMEEVEFDFLITAAYGQFIPKSVLSLPKIKVLNVHGSELPKYRGGAPIERAIENGEEYLGVSIMETISKMDAGVVYKTSLIKNEIDDNYGTMSDKLAYKGREDLVEIIDKMYLDKDIPYTIQNEDEVTFAPNITKEEQLLDFNNEAIILFNKIRAFNPSPICYFVHDGIKYKVYSSKVISDNSDNEVGIIINNDKELVIKCKNSALSINEIQKEGKSTTDIKSFLNGNKNLFIKGSKI